MREREKRGERGREVGEGLKLPREPVAQHTVADFMSILTLFVIAHFKQELFFFFGGMRQVACVARSVWEKYR